MMRELRGNKCLNKKLLRLYKSQSASELVYVHRCHEAPS